MTYALLDRNIAYLSFSNFNIEPFCGPFLAGTPESPTDRAIGRYLMTSCGFGYEEGTDEAKAYVNLYKILKQCVAKPRLRNEILRAYHLRAVNYYQDVLSVYGSNDPWTGGAIDSAAAETNPHIVMVLDLGGIHTTDFLNQNSFSKESSQQIQTWVKAFLGL